MKRTRLAAAVMLACVACGGGDDAPAASDFTLRLEDFGDGGDWTQADPAPDDEAAAALEKAAEQCESEYRDRIEDDADSPNFSSGNALTASSTGVITDNASTAEEIIANFEAIVGCYGDIIIPALEQQAQEAGGAIRTVPFYEVEFPSIGERTAAWSMQFGTAAASFFIDFVLVQSDRGLLEVAFLNDGSLSQDEKADIVRSAAERMPGG